MKGFPNQVADLGRLAKGIDCLVRLVDQNEDAKDDGVFGRALVRTGVAGTGHTAIPVNAYIRTQLDNPPDRQSFRTTARGLRQLYRLLRFIDDGGPQVYVTERGREAAEFANASMNAQQIEFWRRAIRDMTLDGEDGAASHPYQVLLRLVARKPQITRAKCALALEARDDSPQELERIVNLSDLPESDIQSSIGVTKSNWDNAKKILPKFAEQLGDVVRTGQSFTLADSPGNAGGTRAAADSRPVEPARGARAPRTARDVTPETIGRAGTADGFDEVPIPPPGVDPEAAAAAVRTRLKRLRRHNILVRGLAARLAEASTRLLEDPFDILALIGRLGFLVEVKTLDGTDEDERERVKEALAQLLYYEAFVIEPVAGQANIRKVACFEHAISGPHQAFLNGQAIASLWKSGDQFAGDALASGFLGRYLEELR